MNLVGLGEIDATRPQIVIYEPMPDGRLQLIGADFLVIASDWDKAHPGQGAPQLMGQLFHYFESPNRFGLPAFYMLHVWAWKENPNRAFVNWHPNVSCQSFSGQSSNAYATNECLAELSQLGTSDPVKCFGISRG